ncbi:flavin reductase family protein [Microbacterium sp. zg-Y818]|uniref:flavin reductase family protein n=1 Tax=unclassified Microbacterium TaxID=2609290 RepID=UPI00214BD570|nr:MULTISPECIES: flavin reductase family protein [unclassified Microbacterium]MCR2799301.1 flavin reductase family protein [Microbacterium sp. zg.Y818]WIM21302.1 flavin reductase family protein [Microbacterium sp. zg-Y818]
MSDSKNVFRQVLGQYPTGVTAVTARTAEGKPVGMAVGSFTSVSMDPPIVGFLPTKTSSSWPQIEAAGTFCVNVLTSEQENVCRAMSARGDDKFAGLPWTEGVTGAPALDGALAWIECTVRDVLDAGDHYIVLGDVVDLRMGTPALPLVFFRGGYGKFSSGPLVAENFHDQHQVRLVNAVRDEMQAVASELGVEASATAEIDGKLVLVATTWSPFSDRAAVRAGDRVPFRPPFALPFAVWGTAERRRQWLQGVPDAQRGAAETVLDTAAERGWAVSVRPEPAGDAVQRMIAANSHGTLPVGPDGIDPRNVSVPVLGPDGSVRLSLSLSGMTVDYARSHLADAADRLVMAARKAERAVASQLSSD